VLAILKLKTPRGKLEVKIRDKDNLAVLAEKTNILGGFNSIDMKQSILVHLTKLVQ